MLDFEETNQETSGNYYLSPDYEDIGLNEKDLSLIAKYTEMPKFSNTAQLSMNTITEQLELNRLQQQQKIEPEKVSQVIGFPVCKEKYLNGCFINEFNDDLMIRTKNEENFFGRIAEIDTDVDNVKKIVYNRKPVELKYDPSIGIKKKILENKYIPHMKKVPEKGRKVKKNLSIKKSTRKGKEDFLEKRKKINNKYTRVKPQIRNKVRNEIIKGSYNLNGRLKVEKEEDDNLIFSKKCCKPNDLVIEQVRAKFIKSRRLFDSPGKEDEIVEGKGFEEIEAEVKRSSREEGNLNRLKSIIEMMDICMKSGNTSVVQHKEKFLSPKNGAYDFSVQVDNISPLETFTMPMSEQKRYPVKKEIQKSKPKMENLQKRVNSVKSSNIEMKKPSPTQKKRKIRLIERNYELESQSYEVSDLICHIPSNLITLNQPIEKEAVKEIERSWVDKLDEKRGNQNYLRKREEGNEDDLRVSVELGGGIEKVNMRDVDREAFDEMVNEGNYKLREGLNPGKVVVEERVTEFEDDKNVYEGDGNNSDDLLADWD